MAFAGAELRNGFDLFATTSGLLKHLRKADLVITGEGMLDRSSLMGKGAGEIARLCARMKVPCIGVAGTTDHSRGLSGIFKQVYALTDLTSSVQAKAKPALWLERLAFEAGSKAKA